jgi:hypothetical protein
MALGSLGMTVPDPLSPSAAAAPAASRDRIQLYRNAVRGLTYLPIWRPGYGGDPSTFQMRVTDRFALDGEPAINVRGNVYPIDVDGDGRYELVHYNGYRIMRVYRTNGAKLWERKNAKGRVHRSAYHRDTLAILNTDGKAGQEIVRCSGSSGATRRLEILKGSNGNLLHSTALSGDPGTGECQIAAIPMVGRSQPTILVARPGPRSAGCQGRTLDNWSRVSAYDTRLRHLWTRTTCDAGHYVWPVDANRDGNAEAVFIGKYLYDAKGNRRCTLPGWGRNHVDSMVIGNLRSDLPGHELVAVGMNGTRAYRASNCSQLWSVPTGRIPNPQQVVAARTAETPVYPWIYIQERGERGRGWRRMFRLDNKGNIVGQYREPSDPTRGSYQTVNVDGDLGGEDRMGAYGRVFNNSGGIRLGTGWYEAQQNLTAKEKRLGAPDKWSFTPLVFDIDRNGRDEIITWGRRALVIGTRR